MNVKSTKLMDIEKVNLSFGGLKALIDVDLQDKYRGNFAIIGPNGAGKSSMLNVISGIYIPQEGLVKWKEKIRKKLLRMI